MDIISILGLGLGLAVLIMMGFKGWGMIPRPSWARWLSSSPTAWTFGRR